MKLRLIAAEKGAGTSHAGVTDGRRPISRVSVKTCNSYRSLWPRALGPRGLTSERHYLGGANILLGPGRAANLDRRVEGKHIELHRDLINQRHRFDNFLRASRQRVSSRVCALRVLSRLTTNMRSRRSEYVNLTV